MRDLDQRWLRRSYLAARMAIPSCDWDRYASAIAADRPLIERDFRKPESQIDRALFDRLDSFRASGLLRLPFSLDPATISFMRERFEGQPVYAGSHVLTSDRHWRPLEKVRLESQLA